MWIIMYNLFRSVLALKYKKDLYYISLLKVNSKAKWTYLNLLLLLKAAFLWSFASVAMDSKKCQFVIFTLHIIIY